MSLDDFAIIETKQKNVAHFILTLTVDEICNVERAALYKILFDFIIPTKLRMAMSQSVVQGDRKSINSKFKKGSLHK